MAPSPQFETVFRRLRGILASQASSLDVTDDESTRVLPGSDNWPGDAAGLGRQVTTAAYSRRVG